LIQMNAAFIIISRESGGGGLTNDFSARV